MKRLQSSHSGQNSARKLVEEARRQFSTGQIGHAEATLQRALALNPKETQALVALGIVAAESGNLEQSIAWMSKAYDVDRNCVPALSWLSYLLLQKNRSEEAKEFAEKALALNPRNPVTQVAMARCLVQLGRYSESIGFFKSASTMNPNDAAVLFEYADAVLETSAWIEARGLLSRAVKLAPDPRGLLRLAYLELRIGNISEAERYCDRALRLDPASTDAHALIARIYTEQGRLDEAEGHWERAEASATDLASLYLDRGLSLTAIGRFDEAMVHLNNSIQANPNQGSAYQAIVFAKKIQNSDVPLISRMEDLLKKDLVNRHGMICLHYSLGKSYDNLGDYQAAIKHFDEANKLKRQAEGSKPLDRNALSSLVDARIRLFTKEFLSHAPSIGLETQLPLWVVGMMRSGTTLAEQILTCHPQLGGTGEQTYWGDNEGFTVDYLRGSIDSLRLRTCGTEYSQLLASLAPNYKHVIDKNPANLQLLGSFHMAFPNARVVYTRRNPIDTALSIWMTPLTTSAEFVSDREDIVFALKEYQRLMDHWREVFPADRFFEIQYEDLVAQPEIYIRKMVSFCGVEWDENCLNPQRNERHVRTPSVWQVRQPLFQSSTDKWKRYEPWLGVFADLQSAN